MENGALAAAAGIRHRLANFVRAGDALAGDIEDHVSGAETLRRARSVGLDLRHHDTLGARARDLVGRSKREAETRNVAAGVVAISAVGLGLALLARQLAERDVDGLLGALADDAELHARARRHAADALGKIARILDRLAVHRRDDVTRGDAGLHG